MIFPRLLLIILGLQPFIADGTFARQEQAVRTSILLSALLTRSTNYICYVAGFDSTKSLESNCDSCYDFNSIQELCTTSNATVIESQAAAASFKRFEYFSIPGSARSYMLFSGFGPGSGVTIADVFKVCSSQIKVLGRTLNTWLH